MDCKGNCRENGGITNRTAEKENRHCCYNGSKEEEEQRIRRHRNYVMICCGVPANNWESYGVAIAIRKNWKHKIQDYTWISDRIIETKIKVLNRSLTIVGVYALVEGIEQDTEEFTGNFNKGWTKFLKRKILF